MSASDDQAQGKREARELDARLRPLTEILERNRRLIGARGQLLALQAELDKDHIQFSISARAGDQVQRRAYARAFFAEVEAIVFQLKQIALHWSPDSLDPEEQGALAEFVFRVRDDGTVRRVTQSTPMLANVRLAFRYFALAAELPEGDQPDFGNNGWEHFQAAVKIRNRVTHPKSVEETQISDADIGSIDAAQGWFRNSLNGVYSGLLRGTERQLAETQEHLHRQGRKVEKLREIVKDLDDYSAELDRIDPTKPGNGGTAENDR